MHAAPDDAAFLRDLVKTSRQKSQHVKWVDRDGSQRISALTREEATRIGSLAKRDGVSPSELLRRAAHVPVATAKPTAASE